jgi:hypothetical protein
VVSLIISSFIEVTSFLTSVAVYEGGVDEMFLRKKREIFALLLRDM